MQNIILFKELPKETKSYCHVFKYSSILTLVTNICVVFYWIGGRLFVFEKIHKF